MKIWNFKIQDSVKLFHGFFMASPSRFKIKFAPGIPEKNGPDQAQLCVKRALSVYGVKTRAEVYSVSTLNLSMKELL
jgi:hypothetical protein